MKILFITYFFAPYNCIGAVRTTRTAELLMKKGHDVKIISADRQNLDPNLIYEFSDKNIYRTKWIDLEKPIYFFGGKDRIKSINNSLHKASIKGKILSFLKSSFHRVISFPDKYIGWYPYAFNQAKQLMSSEWMPDVIYASATPYTSLLIAQKISNKYGIPWVGELRDLWSDNHYGYSWWIDKKIEKSILKSSSSLITVSEPLTEILKQKYPNIPSHTILNAFDDKDFKIDTEKITKKNINIVYTGSVYEGKRDPTPLFEALISNEELRKFVQVDFYGNNLGFVDSLIKKYNLHECVNLKGEVTREEALKKQSQADVLLLLTWNNIKERGVLTGKLFEYIGAAKPILSIGSVHDVASKLVESNNFGVATNKPDEINFFLRDILKNNYKFNYDNRMQYERNGQVKLLERILCDSLKNT